MTRYNLYRSRLDFVFCKIENDFQVSLYTKANCENCNGMVHCLNQLFQREKVAAIVPRKFAQIVGTNTGLPIFCFGNSESFNRVTRTFTLKHPNDFLLNKTNFFIRQAMETGHLRKWEVVGSVRENYKADSNGPVVLTVKHISGGLVVYMGFATAAILCLIGERLAFKRVRRGNNGIWKWCDKFIFSTERLICASKRR